MVASGMDWAGYSFLALGHHDGRFVRTGGVYAFVRRGVAERVMLYAGEADCISAVAGPGHPEWAAALALGLTELHVFIRPRERIERLLVLDRVVRRCLPILNLVEPGSADGGQRSANQRIR